MGHYHAAGAAIYGGLDIFDRVVGYFEDVEERLKEAHPEEERKIAFHPGDGPVPEGFETVDMGDTAVEGGVPYVKPHFCDPIASLLEEIETAKKTVRELDLLYQRALEAL